MNKKQWIVITSAAILFCALYFGFNTSPDKHKLIEEQRKLSAVSTDITSLLREAKESLTPQQIAVLSPMESAIEGTSEDSLRSELLKQLSSTWYSFNQASIAGFYAEEVAQIERNEEAWSVAGTTYSICVQREPEGKTRSFCTERAISSLEKAYSLNPSNIQHRTNLALVYAENPPKENPMKGILMLVELNKQYPENVSVLTQLGRLAIKTGQFEKAIQRLEKAVQLDPENPIANCLLARAFDEAGQQAQAEKFKGICESLSTK